LAYEKNIEINQYHFSNTKKAMCIHIDNYKSIALDKKEIESKIEETEILAEELGHYETGSLYAIEATYNQPLKQNNIIYFEAKAKKWKTKRLLPYIELQKALNKGIHEVYALSEYFNLSEIFIKDAINLYKSEDKISINNIYLENQ